MRIGIAFLAVLCALGDPCARAEESTAITMMKGHCRKLTTPADDLSDACRGSVVSTAYTRDGRVDFYFASGEQAVTFSGGATQIRINETGGVQRIDKVMVGAGRGGRSIVAVGSCRYTNALTPKPMVNCKAETEEGLFLASFDVISAQPAQSEKR